MDNRNDVNALIEIAKKQNYKIRLLTSKILV